MRQNRLVLKRVVLWVPPLVYMALVFHLSSQSDPLPVLTEHVWDKLLHAIEYGGLGALVCRALLGEGLAPLRAVLLATLLTGAYGASDEWHQAYVPNRDSDVLDWLTDDLGAAGGALAFGAAQGVLRPTAQER
jgi:VanZ family protein